MTEPSPWTSIPVLLRVRMALHRLRVVVLRWCGGGKSRGVARPAVSCGVQTPAEPRVDVAFLGLPTAMRVDEEVTVGSG